MPPVPPAASASNDANSSQISGFRLNPRQSRFGIVKPGASHDPRANASRARTSVAAGWGPLRSPSCRINRSHGGHQMYFIAAVLAVLAGLFYAAGHHEIGSWSADVCRYGSTFCDSPTYVLAGAILAALWGAFVSVR